ncbi:hypothetical protein PJL18_03874 [Paenarthrobacter nicotinovorans]|nr:hypothetical protein [Paenarthrobacter nicotinovorans]
MDEEAWASATSRWMPASAVSSPTAVTVTRTVLSVATVPATTGSPSARSTVLDSPVIIDSSNSARPSTMVPSAGIRAPDRTRTTSPCLSSDTGTVSTPASVTRSASSGRRAARASKAPCADPSALISIQWPSSMMATSNASSHQKSKSKFPIRRVVAQDATNATVMAMEISSIIPGCRVFNSLIPPLSNGCPP